MRAGVRGAAAFGCVGRVQPRCDEADAGAFAYSSYRSVVDGTNMHMASLLYESSYVYPVHSELGIN